MGTKKHSAQLKISKNNLMICPSDRPESCCQEVGQLSANRQAESSAEMVTLGAVSLHMVVHAGEKVVAVMIWLTHVLE